MIYINEKWFHNIRSETKVLFYIQARYIAGGPSAFKLPHTAPPIYLNSDLKGPLTAGVREEYSLFHVHFITEPWQSNIDY